MDFCARRIVRPWVLSDSSVESVVFLLAGAAVLVSSSFRTRSTASLDAGARCAKRSRGRCFSRGEATRAGVNGRESHGELEVWAPTQSRPCLCDCSVSGAAANSSTAGGSGCSTSKPSARSDGNPRNGSDRAVVSGMRRKAFKRPNRAARFERAAKRCCRRSRAFPRRCIRSQYGAEESSVGSPPLAPSVKGAFLTISSGNMNEPSREIPRVRAYRSNRASNGWLLRCRRADSWSRLSSRSSIRSPIVRLIVIIPTGHPYWMT